MKIFICRVLCFFLCTSILQAESVRLAPEAEPPAFQAGYTSYSPGQISGIHDLHNVRLFFNRNDSALSLAKSHWTVTLGCGTQRIWCGCSYAWRERKGISPEFQY